MSQIEMAAHGRSCDIQQAGGDLHAGRGNDLDLAGRKFTLQRPENCGTGSGALAFVDVGDHDSRAPFVELRLE